MIDVNNLSFDYPGKRALSDISFTILPNTITALVGPNGAGKTTLLRCLAALENPMLGTIKMDTWDTLLYPRKVHEACSYLSDFFGLYDDLTVMQSLQFFAWSHHCTANSQQLAQEAAKRLDIWEYKNVAASKLSRGLRQRLAIAQTIIHKPKILLLDEPASGLDPQARFNLSQLLLSLQKEGMTLFVSSHILAELEDYSTHMIVLHDGKIVKHCALNEYQNASQDVITLKVELTEDAQTYVELLKSIPQVTVKTLNQNVVILDFQGKKNDQRELLKTLIEKQIPVYSIQEQKQRMQDVYLNIAKDTHPDKETKE